MSESHSDHEKSSEEDVDVGQFVSKRRLVTSESAFFVKKLVEVFTKEKKAKQRFKVSRPYDRAVEISVLQVSCLKKIQIFVGFHVRTVKAICSVPHDHYPAPTDYRI